MESAAGIRDFLLDNIPDDVDYEFDYVDERIAVGLIDVGTIKSPHEDFQVEIIADVDGYDYLKVSGDMESTDMYTNYKVSSENSVYLGIEEDELIIQVDDDRIVFSDGESEE